MTAYGWGGASMSQRVVRYEGEGRSRRPVYADEGPAAPGATDGLASLGRLSALTSNELDDGAGRRVERRQITDAEIAARAVVRPATAPQADPAVRREAAMPVVLDGEPPDVPPDPPRPETRDVTLAALLDAARTAVEAWEEVVQSEHLLDQAQLRWEQARSALDAAYRALDDPPPVVSEPSPNIPETIPEQAPELPSTATTTSTGPSATSSTTGSRARRRTVLSPNQQRVLAATERHGGEVKAVAAELGFKHYQSVTSCLQDIGKKGLLPVDLIPKLPAAFARFGVPL